MPAGVPRKHPYRAPVEHPARRHPRTFLGGQANQVDRFHRAQVRLAGIEATGEQNFLNQLVQFGNVAFNFVLNAGEDGAPISSNPCECG